MIGLLYNSRNESRREGEARARARGERAPPMGRGKQQHRGGKQHAPAHDEEEEERSVGSQNAKVGLMPPSSSDEDSDDEPGGQNPNAGMMPPSSSDEDSGSDDEEPKSKPTAKAPAVQQLNRKEREALEGKKKEEEELDPEQLRKDMERLAMVKKRREEQAAKRIEKDGWDRMRPIGPDNHPPGMREPEGGWENA